MSTPTTTGFEITLPSLGENVEEATVTRWLVAPGERVAEGEALLEVATDKVDTEIPSPATGVLESILVAEDELVAVGAVLAVIASEQVSGPPPAPPAPAPAPPAPAAAPTPAAAPAAPAPTPTVTDRAPAAPTPGVRVEKLPKIRQTIARRMLESLQTSAQLTSVVEADITAIAALRTAHKDEFAQRTGVKLSFLPFFAKAVVEALGDHPVVNAFVNDECTEISYHDHVHLGMAVDSPKGLMVPVIRDAQRLTITDLAREIAGAADRVRTGKISPDELNGGTFTLTNTGSRGALFDTPILNRPQSGILGTGAVVERVVPQRDASGALTLGVRSMVYLALSYDHRIVDGADAARFLGAVRSRLEAGFTPDDLA